MKGKPGSGEIKDADPYRIKTVGLEGTWLKCHFCKHGRVGIILFKSFDLVETREVVSSGNIYVCLACLPSFRDELRGSFYALPSDMTILTRSLERYYKMKIERLERKLVARSIELGKARYSYKRMNQELSKTHRFCCTKNLNEGK